MTLSIDVRHTSFTETPAKADSKQICITRLNINLTYRPHIITSIQTLLVGIERLKMVLICPQ